MLIEPTAYRLDQKVKVPSDDGDDEEVDGHSSRADLAGGQVHHYGRGHAYPHLSDDVGRDEAEEAPRVGQEQGSSGKRCSQDL